MNLLKNTKLFVDCSGNFDWFLPLDVDVKHL